MSILRALPIAPYTLYRVFKYSVYALLTTNIFIFFFEDHGAAAQMFTDGITWRNLVDAYSSTIDTIAWVILLLLFELETAVISDDKLRGSLKWILMSIRAVCYGFIVTACYGYINKYADVTHLLAWQGPSPCDLTGDLAGDGYTYVADLDEYPPIDADSCEQLGNEPLQQIAGTQILGTAQALKAAIALAVVDIINSVTWLIVVAILELEVFLQLNSMLTDKMMLASKAVKSALYLTLLGCATYWGFKGDFIPDFWDAFLWLVAFVFIEMNIFEWHEDTREQASSVTPSTS